MPFEDLLSLSYPLEVIVPPLTLLVPVEVLLLLLDRVVLQFAFHRLTGLTLYQPVYPLLLLRILGPLFQDLSWLVGRTFNAGAPWRLRLQDLGDLLVERAAAHLAQEQRPDHLLFLLHGELERVV